MKKIAYAVLTSAAALALAACGSAEKANDDVMAEDTETMAEDAVADPMATDAPMAEGTMAADPMATAMPTASARPLRQRCDRYGNALASRRAFPPSRRAGDRPAPPERFSPSRAEGFFMPRAFSLRESGASGHHGDMPDTLKITLAQMNQSVGDVAGNAARMLAARDRAKGSDLIVFPELQLIGYPPEDLILKPALIERAVAELENLAKQTTGDGPAMLVGSVFVLDGALHNGVALLEKGKIAAVRLKHELPNYGTFDEMRLFQPGPLPEPIVFKGVMIGVPICEDIWQPDVCRHLADFGAEILICINGSPYEINKDALRIESVAKRRAADTGLPLAYLNRIGGQDELVFDGASFVVNGDGTSGRSDARLGRAGGHHLLDQDGAGLALRPGRTSVRLPKRPRKSTAPWCWACATMSIATAFPASCWAFRAASTAPPAPRSRSMRWARTACGA